MYSLSINHEGIDYEVEVEDLEMASLLINDPEAAYQYMQQNLRNLDNMGLTKEDPMNPEPSGSHLSLQKTEQNTIKCLMQKDPIDPGPSNSGLSLQSCTIWSTKKPTEADTKATYKLLELRKQKNLQFADKKTKKNNLWSEIAANLKENGFNVGENGAERCRQKFSNLQRIYLQYISNQKTTGSEKIEIPTFFDELHAILGDKHKVNPVSLQDSLEDNGNGKENMAESKNLKTNENTESEDEEEAIKDKTSKNEADITNRFRRPKKSLKPSKKGDLVKEIQEERKKRSEDFDFFKEHLKRSEQQREKLLDILEKSLLGKKRKREESSDSESD